MARKYNFDPLGKGAYQRSSYRCATAPAQGYAAEPHPAQYKPPIFRDLGLYLEDILRGKTETLTIAPPPGLEYGNLYPCGFVFSGTRDLWLLPTSSCDYQCFINEPLPLDTFRAGAPHQVSWPRLRPGYNQGELKLDIENRGRARNEPKGTFIGRLTCIVKDDC